MVEERSRWLVVVMCVGYFLVLLDVTIVNVALPQIGTGIDAGVVGLQWVVDGYAVALASLLLAGGAIGDVYGHKRVVLTGLVMFGVASLSCGLAPDVRMLVMARVFQGVGAALLLPGTLAIISRAFPDRSQQARVIGVWAAVGAAALPAGPLLGGMLVDTVGWRAVFLVNLPVVAVAAVVAAQVVRESEVSSARRVDWPGTVLGGLLLASVTYAVIRVGHDGMDRPAVVAAAASVVLLVAFVAAERAAERAGGDPMLPLGLLLRADLTAANLVAAAMNLGTLGLLFVLTMYLQTVQHRSALASGAAVLPLFLPLSALGPMAGRLTARVGPRLPMTLGLVSAATGVALFARLGPTSDYLEMLPVLLLWGCGLGLLTPAVVAAAVAALEPERAGLASGMNNTARQAGGAIGVAVFGAVAGSATRPFSFVSGMHALGVTTAGLYLAAAMLTLAVIPSVRRG